MDVVGIIVNVINLADYVQTAILTLAEAESTEAALAAQIRGNVLSLRRFIEAFKRGLQNDFSDDEKNSFVEICLILQPDLARMQSTVSKISSADSAFKRFMSRVTWLSHRDEQIRALALQVASWVQLFQGRMASLPPSLQRRLLGDTQEEEALESRSNDMHQLATYFGRLALKARSQNLPPQRRAVDQVLIKSILGNLRLAEMEGTPVLVEYKSYDVSGTQQEQLRDLEEQIGRLTAFLSLADPLTMSILKCRGYIHEPDLHRFGVLFSLQPLLSSLSPSDVSSRSVRTLHSTILAGLPSPDGQPKSYAPCHPLEERYRLACMVSVAVLYLQKHDWVHKAIKSQNILLISQTKSKSGPAATDLEPLGYPFLVGYDSSRSTDVVSTLQTIQFSDDEQFSQDIYRHPDYAQGVDRVRYQMCYDKYSIGVVLLEIGLWMPLEKWKGIRKIKTGEWPNSRARHEAIRRELVDLADRKLSVPMGTKYRDVVLSCLNTVGDAAYDHVDYLENVVTRLWDIRVAMS